MFFNDDLQRDTRTRFYLPVQRIVQERNTQNADILLNNREIQLHLHCIEPNVQIESGGSVLLDFDRAVHGGIRILNQGSSNTAQINFGESVSEAINVPNQDHSLRQAEVVLPPNGMLEYGNTVFRFVRITATGEKSLTLRNILAVVLERDIEVTGSFESSDERLNKIWATAVRTVHLCMQDYIYDGSKRDRLVWMGDMHPEIKGILCAFSNISIIKDSLEYVIAKTPYDTSMNNIYSYNCWFVISVWEYYMATEDGNFLECHADYIEKMLKIFVKYIRDDGSECIPERRFLDWPNNDNAEAKHAGLQALLLWMMQSGEKILKVLGRNADFTKEAQKKLVSNIPDPIGRKAPAALLTLTGLADRRDVLEQNPLHGVSTFYGYYMLLAKQTVPALELIRKYYGGMIDFGATSFWEDFDLDWTQNAFGIDSLPVPGKKDIHADFGNYCFKGLRHSLSHGWSCGPAPFLSERVLGVKILEPGGKSISVTPDLGDLEYVSGSFPTRYGVVKIEADCSGKVNISAPDEIEIKK